jgi:hypothetical protein
VPGRAWNWSEIIVIIIISRVHCRGLHKVSNTAHESSRRRRSDIADMRGVAVVTVLLLAAVCSALPKDAPEDRHAGAEGARRPPRPPPVQTSADGMILL